MTRQEFLKNFRKHLKKYGSIDQASWMIGTLSYGGCPFIKTDHKVDRKWIKQSEYYQRYNYGLTIRKQMISEVEKVYK